MGAYMKVVLSVIPGFNDAQEQRLTSPVDPPVTSNELAPAALVLTVARDLRCPLVIFILRCDIDARDHTTDPSMI